MEESSDLFNIDESSIKLNQVPINKSISKKSAFKQDQNGMVNPYLSFADNNSTTRCNIEDSAAFSGQNLKSEANFDESSSLFMM